MTARNRFPSCTVLIPAIAVAAICLGSAVHADQAAEYWQKGEELYETHHLAPDRFDQALEWYEKAIALRPNDYELLWELSKRYQIYGQTLGGDQKKEKLEHWKKGVDVRPQGGQGKPGRQRRALLLHGEHRSHRAAQGNPAVHVEDSGRSRGRWTGPWKSTRTIRPPCWRGHST